MNSAIENTSVRTRFSAVRIFRLICFLSLFVVPGGCALVAAEDISIRRSIGLQWPDWIVVAAYLAGMILLGAHYSRRHASSAEYFTAASNHISPYLVGVSFYASLVSTISYLGKPGEMVRNGPAVLAGQIISVPIVYAIVSSWIMPRIMAQRVTSAYELLEARLGRTGRLLGAILFIKLRLVWMGLLVYVASTAIVVILNIGFEWVPLASAVVAIVPLIYTSMGGLRAVVMANVIQFGLLLLGALVSIAIVTVKCGGFSWWPTTWPSQWEPQPLFSWDPRVRATLFGATISVIVWRVCTAGSDQMAIQHYMATRDVAAARRSYLVTSIVTVLITVLLAVLGLALLGLFERFPALLGPGMTVKDNADHLFPYFISNLLPLGISGLVVAAIIAAASGMDTGINAVTAVVMRDIFERFGWRPESEAKAMRTTKIVSFALGIAVLGASLLVEKVPGNFIEMTNKLANLEVTTIFGLFFLALFVPCATPLGAVMGAVYGLTVSVVVAFWDLITGRQPISFLYIGVVGLVVDLGIGYLVSRFGPRPDRLRASMTWGGIMVAALAGGVMLAVNAAGMTGVSGKF